MFGAPTPILRSFDEQRTKAFYLDFLGFELEFEHRFADWAPLYLGVRKGGCRLHLSEHYGDCTPGSAIRIPVDDVSAYAEKLRALEFGNSRPGEPQRTPWGTREITIADPASNRLTFYTEDVEDED
ncbi:VOC family protein [Altererythrobacter xixiisoli]|uniref:Bleomycin resistance protein n=1 Tax=Croceibacterium xixiisoli TaxID=1476466 RepID=A0A6I4TT38_9SPHN|nr:glyoxalase superfamily protein [Croceibacterium xixiisoli]MXO98291.1 VOC family protein [Croceibacterium xixiisoli]